MNAATLHALAEPNRLHIVELLRQGPFPVGEIAKRLVIRQPQASKHLRVLSDAGIVRVRSASRQRLYQLQPKPFEDLDDWLKTFSHVWEGRFDAFDDYLKNAKSKKDT